MPDPDPLETETIDATPCEQLEAFESALAENLAGPRRVRGESGEVEQHSISDQIKAANYLAAKCAAKRPNRGLTFTKLIPPGTT